MSKPPIDFYFDVFSPFAYLAATRIDALAARHGRTTDWKPVLVGVTVVKVMGMKPLPEYPLKGPYLAHDAQRLAKLWNAPLRMHGLRGHTSFKAMRAYVWLKARDPQLAKRFAMAMFEKLWTRGEDFTLPQSWEAEARALDIDLDELKHAIGLEETKQALHRDVESAVAAGVFGVPFVIADGEPFFGCDHFWMLETWLAKGVWTPD